MSKPFMLLTGATGFVGFRVLALALEAGYRIRIAIRKPEAFDKIKSLPSVVPYVGQLESVIVPDITTPGAYDDAVKDVQYIIHVASPLPRPWFTDFENDLFKPAIEGTKTMLEAAYKTSSIKKLVITSSIVAVVPAATILFAEDNTIYNERSRVKEPAGPAANLMEAYFASKVKALNYTETWIQDKKPSFDIVNVAPGFVLGRNETVTDPKDITSGSNGFLMRQLLGTPEPYPMASYIAHVDDVAKVHLDALNPYITGNPVFLVLSEHPEGPNWEDALEYARKHYPKQVEEGVFKLDAGGTKTHHARGDASFTETTFGFKLKTYEEAAVDTMSHYLELVGNGKD